MATRTAARVAFGVGAVLLALSGCAERPGAVPAPSSGIAAPLAEIGCADLDGHSSWRVPGTLDSVQRALEQHPSTGLRITDIGQGGDRTGRTDVEVTESVPTGGVDGGSSLVYSAVQDGRAVVDLRVDAEVVMADESCARFRPGMEPAVPSPPSVFVSSR